MLDYYLTHINNPAKHLSPHGFWFGFTPPREGQGQAGLKQGWLVGFYLLSFFYYFYYFIYFTFPAFSSKGFLESFQKFFNVVVVGSTFGPPPQKKGSEGKNPNPEPACSEGCEWGCPGEGRYDVVGFYAQQGVVYR